MNDEKIKWEFYGKNNIIIGNSIFTLEELQKRHETKVNELMEEIEKLEEENKTYRHQLNSAFDRGFIHKDKIKIQIEQLESMNVGGEAFTTAVKFATKILEELLED